MELGLCVEMEISGRFSPFDIMWSWEVSCGPGPELGSPTSEAQP